MKRLLLIFFVLIVRTVPTQAQGQWGWCGYALISGLPLVENQLSVFEALTPSKSSTVNPYQLFQYRYSLDHTEVIIEGCWGVPPTRDVVAVLLQRVIPASPSLIQAVQEYQSALNQQLVTVQQQIGGILPTLQLEPTVTPTLDPQVAVADYIDENLTVTLFAPGGTDADSAAAARAYIAANDAAWDAPEQ